MDFPAAHTLCEDLALETYYGFNFKTILCSEVTEEEAQTLRSLIERCKKGRKAK